MPGWFDAHPELPVDPDSDQADAAPPKPPPRRPHHVQPLLIALVAIGGLAGALARYAVSLAAPSQPGRWPWGTFVENLTGALLLGALLEGLARSGPDVGWRQRVRLLAGTGFCGAFTTYSTLAVETVLLRRDHALMLAALYPLVSVVAGLLATAVGIGLALGHHHVRGRGGDAA